MVEAIRPYPKKIPHPFASGRGVSKQSWDERSDPELRMRERLLEDIHRSFKGVVLGARGDSLRLPHVGPRTKCSKQQGGRHLI